MDEQTVEEQPDRIGPYRIAKALGEGGVAVVYLAEQDEPVRRSVALKILKPGMDSKQIVARFESERQALAVLDHAGVAKIHDGGVADSGRPYFVMEYVDGLPITEFCDHHRLNTTKRLMLFVAVCHAVQHAHLKGLVHRDLKPSNILVTLVDGEPQPKVIDFGIAKAMEVPLTEATLQTRIGQFIGTPHYMSPEQTGLSAQDVDSRADIYSLGVVLYELLVGTLPLDLTTVREVALPAVIRDKVPPTPSARLTSVDSTQDEIANARDTSAPELGRQLKGDLDWIVMKAIEKDRTRRYETANALAVDCQRFLNRQPVSARPPSTGYLLRRFAQRNRAGVAAASVALLAIVGGAFAATVGYLRATDAEQVARQEAETATQISDFLVGLFEVSDPSQARGNSITAREVLDSAVQRMDDLPADPSVRSRLSSTMARVYASLGLYSEAIPLAEEALILRRNLGEEGELLADSLDQLGTLRAYLGDPDSAIDLHEEALRVRALSGGKQTAAYVGSLQRLATAAYLQSDLEGARDHFIRALELVQSAEPVDRIIRADIIGNLGVIFDMYGDFENAMAYKRRAVEAFDDLYGPVHPRSATARNNLALTLSQRNRSSEAIAVYRASLESYRQLYPDGHPETANALNNLAQALLRSRQLVEAETLQREALAMFESVYGPEHTQVATATTNLGRILGAQGQLQAAEAILREGLQLQIMVSAPGHRRIFSAGEALADVLIKRGKLEEGKKLADDAWKDFESRYGEDHWRTARASSIYAAALIGEARFEPAIELLIAAVPRLESGLGDSNPATQAALSSLVTALERSNQSQEAVTYRARLESPNSEL